jgi:hypothetical protein
MALSEMIGDGKIRVEARIKKNGVETVIRFTAIQMDITKDHPLVFHGQFEDLGPSEVRFRLDMGVEVEINTSTGSRTTPIPAPAA